MKAFSFVNVSLFPVLLWCFGVMNKLKLHVWTILVSFIYINKYRSWIKSQVHNNNADVFGLSYFAAHSAYNKASVICI